MKLASVLLLSCAALIYAADQNTQTAKNPAAPNSGDSPQAYKKLGAVTWNPDTHKLQWTVETGSMVNGEFVPASKKAYEISPDDATMGTAVEKRGFDDGEATELHQLLDILSLYCAESVEWWEQGAGAPAVPKPKGTDTVAPDKPVKVRLQEPADQKAAPAPVAAGPQIAALQVIR